MFGNIAAAIAAFLGHSKKAENDSLMRFYSTWRNPHHGRKGVGTPGSREGWQGPNFRYRITDQPR